MNVAARSCGPRFFPLGQWNQVPATAVQKELRASFERWGLPQRFRVDNGCPWGSKGDLPPELALWLIGLGVEMTWNPPRRPQDNGVVERSQGTGRRWAEPATCRNASELQERLREMDRIQREEYPSVEGRSRLEAYPTLAHSAQPYSAAWERRHWSLSRVAEHLAAYSVPRRVDRKGLLSLYNRSCYVGKQHGGKLVYVTFDPLRLEWLFLDDAGQHLRSHPAPEISRDRIVKLQVLNRRSR